MNRHLLAVAALVLSGCTAEQVYNSGQAWQRNKCNGIADKAQYDRCASEAGESYETYRKETQRQ